MYMYILPKGNSGGRTRVLDQVSIGTWSHFSPLISFLYDCNVNRFYRAERNDDTEVQKNKDNNRIISILRYSDVAGLVISRIARTSSYLKENSRKR